MRSRDDARARAAQARVLRALRSLAPPRSALRVEVVRSARADARAIARMFAPREEVPLQS